MLSPMTDTMRDEGMFQDTNFFVFTNGHSDFCTALKELLDAVLTFSRNTAWKCRSNGHTDLGDVSTTRLIYRQSFFFYRRRGMDQWEN